MENRLTAKPRSDRESGRMMIFHTDAAARILRAAEIRSLLTRTPA